MLLLGKFLAAQSLRDYRVALDVVQHDKPGCPHGHVLYKNDGALWVYQAACKLNYVDDMATGREQFGRHVDLVRDLARRPADVLAAPDVRGAEALVRDAGATHGAWRVWEDESQYVRWLTR